MHVISKRESRQYMSVPKGRRKLSRFEASHNYYKLRGAITDLMLHDFGFSEEKYRDRIEKYRSMHSGADNVDEVVARMEKKSEAFNKWFIDRECDAVLEMLRLIETEFTLGNSIYPSETPMRLIEYCIRRYHINKAIGGCYALKQEMNYIIRTLPVDMNKYERFAEEIDKQVVLYKGVRQSDNRFLKQRKNENDLLAGDIAEVLKKATSIFSRLTSGGE